MDEPTYFLHSQGKVRGPFTLAHLQGLQRQGRLTAQDRLSTDRRSWQPAGQVLGLPAAPAPVPTPAPLPPARQLSPRPPVQPPVGLPPAAPAPVRLVQVRSVGRAYDGGAGGR